jgi:hypothetical protein
MKLVQAANLFPILAVVSLGLLAATGCAPEVNEYGIPSEHQAAFDARVNAVANAPISNPDDPAVVAKRHADAVYSGRILGELINSHCGAKDNAAVVKVLNNSTQYLKFSTESLDAQRDHDRAAVSALQANANVFRNESFVLEAGMQPECSAAVEAVAKFPPFPVDQDGQ